jgi:predicted HicB family RNase H-like nuclease
VTNQQPKYSFQVAWSERDAAYVAVSAEFPQLSGLGSTPDEAVRQLQVAIDLAIDTYKDEGWPLPEPIPVGEYSGQFRLRLPKSLHHSLAVRAQAEGISLNTLAVTLLTDGLARPAPHLRSAEEYGVALHEIRSIGASGFGIAQVANALRACAYDVNTWGAYGAHFMKQATIRNVLLTNLNLQEASSHTERQPQFQDQTLNALYAESEDANVTMSTAPRNLGVKTTY